MLQRTALARFLPAVAMAFALLVPTPSHALIVATFNYGDLACTNCDAPYNEAAVIGQPVKTLQGATWVLAPDGNTVIAGGLSGSKPVNIHLELKGFNASAGTTHYLISFTVVINGQTKPGQIHIRDKSPRSKGEIKMIARGSATNTLGYTNEVEQTFQTPGADFTLSGSSSDALPWDHAINSGNLDWAINVAGLAPGATWGITNVTIGAHRMPCHCDPNAAQSRAPGCSLGGGDTACCVPQNVADIEFNAVRVYCPTGDNPALGNACGQPQATAWTCPGTAEFSCASTPNGDGNGTFTCTDAGGASCTYTAKICQ